MAFRHFQGSPPVVHAAWTCPTCGAKNVGALEDGCPACKVGQDAQVAGHAPVDLTPVRAVVNAYVAWREGLRVQDLPDAFDDQLQFAFTAGAAWQREQAAPAGNATPTRGDGGNESSVAATTGGWVLLMVPKHGDANDEVGVDTRTQGTILAALAFYRDNQLAYGAVPGQLSAQECTALIAQLSPQEEDHP